MKRLPALASSSGPDVTVLAQYGAVGLLAAISLTTAWVFYKRLTSSQDREISVLKASLAHETERGDRLEAALADLNATIRTQVMVALAEAQRAVTDSIARMRHDR